MFLNEYYFGYSFFVTFMRIAGGPLCLVLGILLFNSGDDRIGIAYGGFCIAFGLYYIAKPFTWILFRKHAFRTIPLRVSISGVMMQIADDMSQSDLDLSKVHRIHRRKDYYAIEVIRHTKIYLPIWLLTERDLQSIDSLVANHR